MIEVTKPLKLELDTPITFRHHHDRTTLFYFDIDRDEKVVIDSTEETDTQRRIDCYVTPAANVTKNKPPGPTNHIWQSEYGLCLVEIDPNTD